jgi:nucleotide-binding universal stress UspA family protein
MKILVCIDTSKAARKVVTFSCRLAKKLEAKVTILHVITVPTGIAIGDYARIDPTSFLKAAEEYLDNFKRKAEKYGLKVTTRVETVYGNPAHRIVELARDERFDLIALGAMGESELRDLLLGSVAHTVSRTSRCPVLIVR